MYDWQEALHVCRSPFDALPHGQLYARLEPYGFRTYISFPFIFSFSCLTFHLGLASELALAIQQSQNAAVLQAHALASATDTAQQLLHAFSFKEYLLETTPPHQLLSLSTADSEALVALEGLNVAVLECVCRTGAGAIYTSAADYLTFSQQAGSSTTFFPPPSSLHDDEVGFSLFSCPILFLTFLLGYGLR